MDRADARLDLDWRLLHQQNVARFIQSLVPRHPELAGRVDWDAFLRIARREELPVQFVPLSRPARLIRFGSVVGIQLNDTLTERARTVYGMHELCHFWRDDPGHSCYYVNDDHIPSDSELFADLFALVVTCRAPERDWLLSAAGTKCPGDIRQA